MGFDHTVDPNEQQTGQGIDHAGPSHPFAGFGPPWAQGMGRGPWGRRGRGGRGGWGPAAWAHEFNAGSGRHGRGGGRHGHGARHEHGPSQGSRNEAPDVEEDLYDITTAAAAAEAEMEFNAQQANEAGSAAEMNTEKSDSPRTARNATGEHPDPPEEVPNGWPGFGFGPGARGCRGRRGGPFGGRGRGGRHGPPPFAFGGGPFAGGGPFGGGPPHGGGFADMARRAKEYFETLRAQMQSGGNAEETDNESFRPPLDMFNTANNWTLHLAVPGAKKEDIGVNWESRSSTLTVSGVVHRPGDEEFLGSMVSGERRVGLFERKIKLPPADDSNDENKDEVDSDHISAKMEDGILVIVVPKLEKEWTDIKKVDIE